MAIEWTKFRQVHTAIIIAEHSGGMTAEKRSDLAQRFGVNEEVLLRCERAYHAYFSSISQKQWHQAKLEVELRMRERGEEYELKKFEDEMEAALSRIQAAEPENEITRELGEAWAALRAALDASTSTPEK